MSKAVFSNRLYYGIKPLIPPRLRLALRGWLARRKRQQIGGVWPILPGSERKPKDWPGWPDGKKFALVVTHDVESSTGVERCRQLMELERKWGVRSSFNFIPEGTYRVSQELRDELTGHGFEVGVHDLHHDGKLYNERSDFAGKAARINRYLEEWNAVGFRSGFMFHNLGWLEDLDIQYDASTFDTDPFEPQPDAAGTIFPFWIEGKCGRGYVELPYTLVQDSTLFLLLREQTPDIWLKKLDWIASQGGMALLNVHPDYVAFNGTAPDYRTFPVELYEKLIEHVRQKYGDSVWYALPREVAHWYGSHFRASARKPDGKPKKLPLQGKKAAVILYSYYATDPRPRREAEALARNGMEVDVICLRRNDAEADVETMDGVQVRRMPLARRREGKFTYLLQYGLFLSWCMTALASRSLRKRYDLVHVHNMPDFLVFSGLVPKIRGARIILDLHDPMPELMMTIFGIPARAFSVRLLEFVEKRSIAFADVVLTPNEAFKEVFVSRSAPAEKIKIVMNSPHAAIFDPEKFASAKPNQAKDRPFVVMYHGLLVERHGLDMAVEAAAQLRQRIPRLQLHFYGEKTAYTDTIAALIEKLKLEDVVHYHGLKSLREIAEIISTIDLGLIPNRLSPFTQINFPTRIFEYLSMRKPIIVPRTRGIGDYFSEDEIVYFEPDNREDLAAKLEWAWLHPQELAAVMERGRKVLDQHCWKLEEERLVALVQNLTCAR